MSRDLAGTIIASHRLHVAAVSERSARMSHGDTWMIEGFAREIDAQFQELATSLGYLVTRNEPHSADGAEAAAPAN